MIWRRLYKNKAEYNADLYPDRYTDVETGHQIIQARQESGRIVASGVVGDAKQDWSVDLAGSALPGHESSPEGEKEWISITIRSL